MEKSVLKFENSTSKRTGLKMGIFRGVSLWRYLLWMILLATLVLSPLAIDVSAYLTFEPIKVMVVIAGGAGVFGVLFLWWVWRGSMPIKGHLILYVLLLYILMQVWATVFSVAPSVSFWGMDPRYHGLLFRLALVCIGVSVVFLRQHAGKTRNLNKTGDGGGVNVLSDTENDSGMNRLSVRSLLMAVMMTATLVSVFGILQRVFPELTQWWNVDSFLFRTFSTLGHPNYLADYLVLVLPLFIWKFLESERWFWWIFCGGVVGVAFLLTLSRSGFLGLLAAGFFFVVVYSWWCSRRKILYGVLVVPLVLVGFMTYANLTTSGDFVNSTSLLSRFVLKGENVRSLQTRLILWPATAGLIKERPVLGYGLDTYALVFSRAAPSALLVVENMNSYADRAHNLILDTLMEIGLLGALALLTLLGYVIVLAARSRSLVALALGSGLVGHLVSQQFGFQTAPHQLLMWFYMGAIVSLTMHFLPSARAKIDNRDTLLRCFRWISRITAVVLVLALFFFTYRYIVRSWLADRLAREEQYAEAMAIAPERIRYTTAWLTQELSELEIQPDHTAQITSSIDFLEKFTGTQDYHAPWYRAQFFALTHDYPKSYTEFNRAIALAPSVPTLYFAYGKVLSKAQEHQRAIDIWQQYLALAPEHWKNHTAYRDGKLSSWERNRYEIFYKYNPDFDDIFDLIEAEKRKLQTVK